MLNEKLADLFEKFAHIHEIRDAKNDFFRVRSYSKASEIIRNLPKDIIELVDLHNKKLKEKIPGIGEAIESKIIEYIETEKVSELEELKKDVPNGLLEMLEIKNLGPKKVKKFYNELQIDDLTKLKEALEDGRIASLKGLGQKSSDKILDSLLQHEIYSKRTVLGLIYNELEEIKRIMLSNQKCIQVEIAGSARRSEETIGDIDLLVSCADDDREEVLEFFMEQGFIMQIEAKGDTKITARLYSGVQIDLRVVAEDEFGAALQYFTGSQLHNVALRTIAKKLNFKINEYGIFKLEDEVETKVGGSKEEEIYEKLNMQFIPPQLRQGNKEIDLALEHKIPKLVELSDVRGDIHCHSTYSDGSNTVEQMALKAIELGYKFLIITDHSPSLAVANGLSEERVYEKIAETKRVAKKLNFPVLCGTEVDILMDGTLDYRDEILKEFDFVIASVHLGLENSVNERILKAIQNPYVNMIGHPTTRLIGKRKPADLEWKSIFEMCKLHNTFLEINCQSLRMDTPFQHVYEGIYEYGLKFAITTDAHSASGLENMIDGVNYAKRGWCRKSDIINCLDFEDFLKVIKKHD